MKELYLLFITFARVGLFTFGGGYAMLPVMQKEICENRKWAEENDIVDFYAIGQCTPGVIAVNVTTFIGYKQKGIPGAIASTLGVIFPSLIIITIIAALIKNFSDLPVVQHAFAGIRIAVCALLVKAIIRFFKGGVTDIFGLTLFIITLILSLILNVSSVILVISAGFVGVAYNMIRRAGK